jgi:hypothetical protein
LQKLVTALTIKEVTGGEKTAPSPKKNIAPLFKNAGNDLNCIHVNYMNAVRLLVNKVIIRKMFFYVFY